MKKTMIYLEEGQFKEAAEFAESNGESFAEVCRQALASYLENKKHTKSKSQDPLMKIVGLGKSKKRNSGSIDHDKILYGK